jgi:hypothetical protein
VVEQSLHRSRCLFLCRVEARRLVVRHGEREALYRGSEERRGIHVGIEVILVQELIEWRQLNARSDQCPSCSC